MFANLHKHLSKTTAEIVPRIGIGCELALLGIEIIFNQNEMVFLFVVLSTDRILLFLEVIQLFQFFNYLRDHNMSIFFSHFLKMP